MAGTYSYYTFSFTEIPDIKFYYKASMPEAVGLIHADITKNHIDNDGNLLDEELTKKMKTIIKNFSLNLEKIRRIRTM